MNPTEVLQQVRRIEIVAGRLVNELFAGQYSSTFKGRGMEFSEVREYLPGDDVRAIDWNVTARTGHPFVKKFIEERELTVIFVIDTSLSLGFGSRGKLKSEMAAEMAAVLAFSALRNSDKVGLILYSQNVDKYIPPRKSRGHVLRIIRDIITTPAKGGGTSLAGALEFLNKVQRRRAVVFLLSDFLDSGYDHNLRITQKRHDTIAIPIGDAWEQHLPAGVPLLFEDAEKEGLALVRLGESAAESYRIRQTARLAGIKKSLTRMGVDAIFTQTGESYVESFLAFFRERARRFR